MGADFRVSRLSIVWMQIPPLQDAAGLGFVGERLCLQSCHDAVDSQWHHQYSLLRGLIEKRWVGQLGCDCPRP